MGVSSVPVTVLNSGGRMPVLGMGTATYPVPPPEEVEAAVYEAIKLGYRHFDSASLYQSERPLGQAVARALDDGLIRERDELFITSKLWCTDAHPDGVLPAIRDTLQALGMDYVDLYLVHFPVRLRGEKWFVFSGEDVIPLDMEGTWEAMEECKRLGLAKAIGVSNFTCKKLEQLLTNAKIVPAVNQVEMHPLWQQTKLREFCAEKGIHVSAYSPLGGIGVMWGTPAVFENEEIRSIAASLRISVAQVCLRWAFQSRVSFLPKSFNKERLKENMEIFDWELSDADMRRLNHLPQTRMVLSLPFVSPNGVYKSCEELWDGEL